MTGQMHLGNKLAYEVKQLYTNPHVDDSPSLSHPNTPYPAKEEDFCLSFLIFCRLFFSLLV